MIIKTDTDQDFKTQTSLGESPSNTAMNSIGADVRPNETIYRGKRCFVIMPFGTKKHPYTNEQINFDTVYEKLILNGLKGIIEPKRSDSTTASGLIHSEMIDDIISADIAIVDITGANPNVMYELGVRHAAKRNGTIVIRQKGDKLPFDVTGIRAFEYPDLNDEEACNAFYKLLHKSVEQALQSGNVDSLVHGLFRGLNVTRRPKVIRRRRTMTYQFGQTSNSNTDRQFCIVTGDIADVMGVHAWVNPENTAMQMGRFYDNSTSATIRYYSAKRDRNGFVIKDCVGDSLRRAMRHAPVAAPGAVFATRSGMLRKTNGVKVILHVAAQHGEPSKGYLTVRNAMNCISNCLRTIDNINNSPLLRIRYGGSIGSVLIPLFGVKSPERIPEQCASDLVQAATYYFEKFPNSSIAHVYFAAYSDVDLMLCEQAFHSVGLKRTAAAGPHAL